MQKQFYISREGLQQGPYFADEILEKLTKQESRWTDFLYDETSEDWIMLMDHPLFTDHFKEIEEAALAENVIEMHGNFEGESKLESSTDVVSTKNPDEKEWFILKGENRHGPFSLVEMIKMLQTKQVFEFDFIWNASMPEWLRLSEVPDFSPDNIRKMKEKGNADITEVFFRRRHARVMYGASLLVHNNKTVWKGQSLELSEGGAGLLLEATHLQPGQTLFLHFKAGDGVPPFNAICAVVSKQYLSEDPSEQKVRYGVKFTSISQGVTEAIRSFTKQRMLAA